MRNSRRKGIELGALIVVYVLFAAIGVYSGQTTMDVDMIRPSDGMEFRSSPVELVARLVIRGAPVSDVRARFTVSSRTGGESNMDVLTDAGGIARLLVPASSGNYTWRVAGMKEGYPRIVSPRRSYSIRLSLVVDALLPSFTMATSPVDFKARVRDENGGLVESANVTFYVDSATVGSSLTGINGIAAIKATVDSGAHLWFASATKAGMGGVSEVTRFLVGLGSLATGDVELTSASCPAGWGQVAIAVVDLGFCGRAATSRSLHSLRIDRGQNEELERPQRVA